MISGNGWCFSIVLNGRIALVGVLVCIPNKAHNSACTHMQHHMQQHILYTYIFTDISDYSLHKPGTHTHALKRTQTRENDRYQHALKRDGA